MIYGAIAAMACIDGAEPQAIIGYASKAIDHAGDARALRARMHLKAGDRDRALADLEQVMAEVDDHALTGGEINPRTRSAPCGWSLADLDTLGNDPRGLAAKALYLSSFVAFGAADRGTVKESGIRDLLARSSRSWHSPIPHFLEAKVEGLGSEHSMTGSRCIRANRGGGAVPEIVNACAKYDEETQHEIRELTMALVIDPKFAPALSERAGKYLQLARASYDDGKPSRRLFQLAINDYSAAIAAGNNDLHTLYCDRALALASIGRYQDSASGYVQGMKYAKNGIEDSPFVYEQLANLYMKTGNVDGGEIFPGSGEVIFPTH
jgi:tetratricopeptide (TPR) repeat protein